MTRLADPEQLGRALERGLAPVAWIAGDETLLVVEAADLVRARARALGFTDRVVLEVGQQADLSMLAGATRSMSLFGERRLIELRVAGKPAAAFGEALGSLLPSPDGDTALLVTSGKLDKTVSQSAWFGAIAGAGLVLEIAPIERERFGAWVAQRLARQQQRASDAALQMIVDRTEGNPLAAHQEIQRLGLLAPAGEIGVDTVDAIVVDSARYEVFSLVEVAMAGQTGRALRMLDGLKAEDAPLPLLSWALADALRRLLKALQAMQGGQRIDGALRTAGIFGRREAASRRALQRLDAKTTLRLLRETARLDRISKGVGDNAVEATDPWFFAERILIGLSGVEPLPGA
ncbi:MAG: DNA polymerase III subunit delta [Lautropia sp.]